MRHIFTSFFLITILAVPWFIYNPEQANMVFSIIGRAGDQIASVVLVHNPKTVVSIKSHYGGDQTSLGMQDFSPKVRILLVPGHEPNYGGAEYGSIKERDMTVLLAQDLQQFLGTNSKYQVYVSRDANNWSPIFTDYFKKNWDNIIAWTKSNKEEVQHLARMGEYHLIAPDVIHNTAPVDVAYRLYGMGKWSNENNIDIIIHIHFNDNLGHPKNFPGKYSGVAIYIPQNQYFNSSTTKSLASTVFNRLRKYNAVSNFSGESGGIIEDQDLIAVGAYNSLDAASMLIEYGYIYEPQFNNPVLYDVAIKDLAFQTYLGLQDFFNDKEPASFVSSFDTLAMPYFWSKQMKDTDFNSKDVFSLQTALVASGVYPPNNTNLNDCPRSGVFGNCTRISINAFQNKYGIIGESGIVGKKTLEVLNSLYAVKTI